jgi:hypothetical protein
MPSYGGTLTHIAVKNAPEGKHFDGGGLYLHVLPSGRYWRMKYRIHGREKLLAFGVYPQVSLAEARERREAARRSFATGLTPAARGRNAATPPPWLHATRSKPSHWNGWHGNRSRTLPQTKTVGCSKRTYSLKSGICQSQTLPRAIYSPRCARSKRPASSKPPAVRKTRPDKFSALRLSRVNVNLTRPPHFAAR